MRKDEPANFRLYGSRSPIQEINDPRILVSKFYLENEFRTLFEKGQHSVSVPTFAIWEAILGAFISSLIGFAGYVVAPGEKPVWQTVLNYALPLVLLAALLIANQVRKQKHHQKQTDTNSRDAEVHNAIVRLNEQLLSNQDIKD